jgi:tripartite-type tricarboxylate transporter receptor subunit TctC
MIHTRQVLAAVGLSLLAAVSAAQAAWPAKPIHIVVPFPPGGGTDFVARVVGERLAQATGATVVIDNRPGAGGNIGLDAVAKSPADGYTLGLGQTANLAINPHLYSKMPYDALKDFTPIGAVASQPMVLVVPTTSLLAQRGRRGRRRQGQARGRAHRPGRQRHGRAPRRRNAGAARAPSSC